MFVYNHDAGDFDATHQYILSITFANILVHIKRKRELELWENH